MIVPSEIRMNILSYVTMNNIKEIYKKYPICNKYIMNEIIKLDICFISHGYLYLKSENEPIITFVKQLCDLGIKATYEHQPSRIDVILIHENINNIYMDIVISDELSNYYIKDSDSDKDYHHSLTHLINK